MLEVKSGTADVAVIDYVMSIGTLAEGSDYSDLKVVSDKAFSPEQYGIALRKDSTETLAKLNDAIQLAPTTVHLSRLQKNIIFRIYSL